MFKVGTPNGAKWNVMPDGMPVFAASDGVLWSAEETPSGYSVVIDHSPRKVATYYAHLEQLFVPQSRPRKGGLPIQAGQMLGIVGASPLDPEGLKHLHFEVWLGGPESRIDPCRIMRDWEVLGEHHVGPRAVAAPGAVARNGALSPYRSVGATGEPYPDWVRALRGEAGVYAIRDARTREVLYVGSSTTRLYDTLTRHFQTWPGQYSENDPGVTYDRASVEVAVRRTAPTNALDVEMRLIARLAPRDNVIGQRELVEEVPF
ncbi:MAG: peptidoglycan DD-metalloendopeptidase family protein [Deltaproteobacteria bacterium]|nr:peptidoglycan DD-metalloendopeptidase family protein [Deltaproteobacteria bacterium]